MTVNELIIKGISDFSKNNPICEISHIEVHYVDYKNNQAVAIKIKVTYFNQKAILDSIYIIIES